MAKSAFWADPLRGRRLASDKRGLDMGHGRGVVLVLSALLVPDGRISDDSLGVELALVDPPRIAAKTHVSRPPSSIRVKGALA